MADDTTKNIEMPAAFAESLLYWEMHNDDWNLSKGQTKFDVIDGKFGATKYVKWDAQARIEKNDSGGLTKVGITQSTWTEFRSKNSSKYPGLPDSVHNVKEKEWLIYVNHSWERSCANVSANAACGCALFQCRWGGYRYAEQCWKELISKADIKYYNYKFKKWDKDNSFQCLADATHAFKDPMIAYKIIINSKRQYLWDTSKSGKNFNNRPGWMRRICMGFTDDGLYLAGYNIVKENGLTSSNTIDQWNSVAIKAFKENSKYIKKLLDWGANPETLAAMASMGGGSYTPDAAAAGGAVSMAPRELYSGCAGVYNLGDYTNSPDMTITPQQTQNREEVLNTLMSGSYTPDEVSKCAELITVDKKKNVKIKRENSEDSKKTDGPTKTETPTKTPTKTDNKEDTKKSKK